MRHMLRHSAFEAERAFSSTYRPEDKPYLCGQGQLLHTLKSRNDAAENRKDQEIAQGTKRVGSAVGTSWVRATSVSANIRPVISGSPTPLGPTGVGVVEL